MPACNARYKPLVSDDDDGDDSRRGSKTVSFKLDGHDNEDLASDTSPPRAWWLPPQAPAWLGWQSVFILFISLGWLSTIAAWHQTISGRPRVSGPAVGSPLLMYANTPIPQEVFEPVRKVFDKDNKYVGASRQADIAWDALVAGHDAVWIEDPEEWGLGEGIIAPFDHPNTPIPKPQQFYVISILHQLHCLNMIRFQYYQEVDRNPRGRSRAFSSSSPMSAEEEEAFKWKVHVEHCFEYLRQAISCGGDLVIEGSSPIKVGKGHATSVTGWGVEHECIDFERLRQFQIDQEAKYNMTWQT